MNAVLWFVWLSVFSVYLRVFCYHCGLSFLVFMFPKYWGFKEIFLLIFIVGIGFFFVFFIYFNLFLIFHIYWGNWVFHFDTFQIHKKLLVKSNFLFFSFDFFWTYITWRMLLKFVNRPKDLLLFLIVVWIHKLLISPIQKPLSVGAIIIIIFQNLTIFDIPEFP